MHGGPGGGLCTVYYFSPHPPFWLGPKFRDHQACRALMGVHLQYPSSVSYHSLARQESRLVRRANNELSA